MTEEEYDKYMCTTYPEYFVDRHKPMSVTCMCWGFCIGPGWYALLDSMCQELMEIHAPVVFDQIKEKYATLRAYYHVDERIAINTAVCSRKDIDKKIDKIIDKYETLTGKTCETCAKPGEICSRGGWYRTCCPECAKKDGYMTAEESKKKKSAAL